MNTYSSQDSQYEDQLLNEYMTNYEKEQMENKQQEIESSKDSFATCNSESQKSDDAWNNEKDNYNTWKDFGTQNHEPIQSTWSFNQVESKEEHTHWSSQ